MEFSSEYTGMLLCYILGPSVVKYCILTTFQAMTTLVAMVTKIFVIETWFAKINSLQIGHQRKLILEDTEKTLLSELCWNAKILSADIPEEKDEKMTVVNINLWWLNTLSCTYIWMGRYNHSLSFDATINHHGIKKLLNHWWRRCHHFFAIIGYHSNSMTS